MYVYKPNLSDKLKVGTLVKVKSSKIIDCDLGVGFTNEMQQFCGEVFMIRSILQDVDGYTDEKGNNQTHAYLLSHVLPRSFKRRFPENDQIFMSDHFYEKPGVNMSDYLFQNHMLMVVTEEAAGIQSTHLSYYQKRIQEITTKIEKI